MRKLIANRKTRLALIVPVVAAGLFTIGAANADSDWSGKGKHDRGEHRYEKMERLSDKLDMTDEQEVKLKQILKAAKADSKETKDSRKDMRKEMMAMSPGDPQFIENVEKQADMAASHMKANMIAHAKVKQDVYAILTDEQKQKMQLMKEKRMKKKEACKKDD